MISGEITEENFHLISFPATVEWKHIFGAKYNERMALVYLDKASAIPIHRSWFKDTEDWKKSIEIMKSKIRRHFDFT